MECKICYELYDNQLRKPLILNCGHSFCSDCMDKLRNAPNHLCPVCKEQITQKQSNYALLDILDSERVVESSIKKQINQEWKQIEEIQNNLPANCQLKLEAIDQKVNKIKSIIHKRSLQLIKQIEAERDILNQEADIIHECLKEKVGNILNQPKFINPVACGQKIEQHEILGIKNKLNRVKTFLNSSQQQLKEMGHLFEYRPRKESIGEFIIESSTKLMLANNVIQLMLAKNFYF